MQYRSLVARAATWFLALRRAVVEEAGDGPGVCACPRADTRRFRARVAGAAGASAATAAAQASASWLGSASAKIIALGLVVCIAGAVVSTRWAQPKKMAQPAAASGVVLHLSALPARVADVAAPACNAGYPLISSASLPT